MSGRVLGEIAECAREAAANVAWTQWATLGSAASSESVARSMIDPEALVLATLSLSNHERRFWDVLTSWSTVGVRLLSVQRVKNLLAAYPEPTRRMAREYALHAHDEVGDRRWKSLRTGDTSTGKQGRGKRWHGDLNLWSEPALMFRLRKGMGVNLRTDLLSFLLAVNGEPASVRFLAATLRYTNAATRRAAEDLASAGLVTVSTAAKPDSYSVDPKAWARVLNISGTPPRWCRWQDVFEYIVSVMEWEQGSRGREISQYALESLGTQLMEKHSSAFAAAGANVRRGTRLDLKPKTGSFENRTLTLCDWMVKHV